MDLKKLDADYAEYREAATKATVLMQRLWPTFEAVIKAVHNPHRMPTINAITDINRYGDSWSIDYIDWSDGGTPESFTIPDELLAHPDPVAYYTEKREREAAERAAKDAAAVEARERAEQERLNNKYGPCA